jgi:hypothetical protein
MQRLGLKPDESSYKGGFEADFERKVTQGGESPRGGDWHIDNPDYRPDRRDDPTFIHYLVSNKFPTEFYSGSVRIDVEGSLADDYRTIYLSGWDEERNLSDRNPAISDQGHIVAAPDYAVVRLGPLTVHRSPIFPETGERTFMRLHVVPDIKVTSIG